MPSQGAAFGGERERLVHGIVGIQQLPRVLALCPEKHTAQGSQGASTMIAADAAKKHCVSTLADFEPKPHF